MNWCKITHRPLLEIIAFFNSSIDGRFDTETVNTLSMALMLLNLRRLYTCFIKNASAKISDLTDGAPVPSTSSGAM